jgi:hypothetical protein
MRTLKISFTVDEQSAGTLLADLANRVQNVDIHVVEDVPYNKNIPHGFKEMLKTLEMTNSGTNKSKPRRVAMNAVLDSLKQKQPQKIDELRTALVAKGASAKSISGTISKLVREKMIKNVGTGIYGLTKKGAE